MIKSVWLSFQKMSNAKQMQTDCIEESGIKARLGYFIDRPAKCCWNCACSGFPYSAACSRIAAEFVTTRYSSTHNLPDGDPAVSECGVCSRWISKAVVKIYRDSASFEEAKLKASVISDGSYTDELDNSFCEEKATPKMQEYMARILAERQIPIKLSPIPFDAVINPDPDGPIYLQFHPSKSFWLVHEWLKINSPIYEEKRCELAKAGHKLLKNFMMRIGTNTSNAV